MLIAIDHGNKSVKLPRGDSFVSGLVESEVAPFGKDLPSHGKSMLLGDIQRVRSKYSLRWACRPPTSVHSIRHSPAISWAGALYPLSIAKSPIRS